MLKAVLLKKVFDANIKLYKSKLLLENIQFTILVNEYIQVDDIQHYSCI